MDSELFDLRFTYPLDLVSREALGLKSRVRLRYKTPHDIWSLGPGAARRSSTNRALKLPWSSLIGLACGGHWP